MTERLLEEVRGALRCDVHDRKTRAENFFLLMVQDFYDVIPYRMILPSALVLTTSSAKALPCFSSSPLTHGDYLG